MICVVYPWSIKALCFFFLISIYRSRCRTVTCPPFTQHETTNALRGRSRQIQNSMTFTSLLLCPTFTLLLFINIRTRQKDVGIQSRLYQTPTCVSLCSARGTFSVRFLFISKSLLNTTQGYEMFKPKSQHEIAD